MKIIFDDTLPAAASLWSDSPLIASLLGAITAGKANPLLLPSFVTAFHSCNKESSPLIDKVRNIVDESQKPEVSLFRGE
jgi:hypothetical protein